MKQLLIQVEQSNQDVQAMGKRIADLESKLKKKQKIKRVIDDKITELLENPDIIKEKKDDESVDKGGADMVKEFYEK
jgi:aldehyde:ferredoxin oxidoreductase